MLLENVVIKDFKHGYCKANISIKDGLIHDVDIQEVNTLDFTKLEFYVTTGFVNSHIHPNQLLDRRMLDELNIVELLHGMHAEYKKTDEERFMQALFVLMEAIKSGSTTIYSVATNPYPVVKAFKTLNVKGAVTCFYNDQWEGFGLPPTTCVLESIREQFEEVFKEQNDKLRIHIGSASIESASNELLILLNDLAKHFNTKVNIHISEGAEAVKSCLRSRGMTPVRLLKHLGILSHNWNLIHAVNIDEEEVDIIAQSKACVIHCPVTNAKTGVGIAPIKKLLKRGVTIGLGTDACSNNNTNNILNEAYFAALIQAACQQDASALPIDTLMQWLTQNGHEIIGTKQRGTIAKGEPADLLLWSLRETAFVPLAYGKFDATLIYNAPDIKPHTVFVDGEIIVDSYKFKIFPEDEIRQAANHCGSRIHHFLTGSSVPCAT